MEQIVAAVRGFDGAFVRVSEPGGDAPEAAWGDAFFYYAPDGRPPANAQPYGTVVTGDLPGDTASALAPAGRWRVNVQVDPATFRALTGEEPRALARPRDHTAADLVLPHPVYGPLGWIAVVNPDRTAGTVLRLLRVAHDAARARHARRHGTAGG
ncbi:DUF6194 family protein [Streptomyces sp. NPDC050560]|uniref:DUF6194 family protein n=1 Tax=Streptomyces sp. NPDC050560 TaxID=3365630 RepID=UPI0037938134